MLNATNLIMCEMGDLVDPVQMGIIHRIHPMMIVSSFNIFPQKIVHTLLNKFMSTRLVLSSIDVQLKKNNNSLIYLFSKQRLKMLKELKLLKQKANMKVSRL